MLRVMIGSAAAAVAMFVVGFVFYGLGLANLATHRLDDPQAQQVQQVLRANLPQTGTYQVPAPSKSALQTQMFGGGPVATVHYRQEGQVAGMTVGRVLKGLFFNFVIALLIGLGLLTVDGRVKDFASRARLAATIGIAGAAFVNLGTPLHGHEGWGFFVFNFLADGAALAAAGIVVAWFLKVEEPVGEAPVVAPVPEEKS
jgi:hypothetical protein